MKQRSHRGEGKSGALRTFCELGNGLYCIAVAIWLFAVLCLVAQPAYAYIDPGAGLYIIQIIGSTFAGFVFLIRKRIRRLFTSFGSKSDSAARDTEES